MSVSKPRSLMQAQRLCELYAEIDGRIAAMEEARDVAIAKANAVVDADLAPLLKERAAIVAKLEPWWMAAGKELIKGKRKSIELGGCVIGSQQGKASLAVAKPEHDLTAALKRFVWARPFLRSKVTLDTGALKKALEGKRKEELEELGFSIKQEPDQFFIKRTGQAGTQAKVAP